MPEFKCVINDPKSGKSYQKALSDESLLGKKIGESVSGSDFGLPGYELTITGGSDTSGFPMRKHTEGPGRRKLVLTAGPGYRRMKRAIKFKEKPHYHLSKRKTIRGNTVSPFTAQINLKVSKYGTKSIEELYGIKQEAAQVAAEGSSGEKKGQ